MNHPRMSVNEVVDLIENDDSFDDFAFRGDNFVPVKRFRKSRYHGDFAKQYQLPGVSAIVIAARESEYIREAFKQASKYGKNVFLLRGEMQNADEIFNDPNEILMVNHEIVCIVKEQA